MITIGIAGMSVPIEQASDKWVAQMLQQARKGGAPPCFSVQIGVPGIQVGLATPGCGSSGGGSRPPNPREAEIIEAWVRRGFQSGTFADGEVHGFIKQLARLV